MVIHNLGRLEDGISVQSRDQNALKVTVTHGLVSQSTNNITLQRTDELSIGTALTKFSLAQDKTLQLTSATPVSGVSVNTQIIDKSAGVTTAPIRRMVTMPK